MKTLVVAVLSLLLTGCLNSSYHYSSSGSNFKSKQIINSRVKQISIGFISSSSFWKAWQKSYFRNCLEDAIEDMSDIEVTRRGSAYRLKVDLRDMSLKGKEKIGKFLGQKQYRVIEMFNVHAWYRIEKKGANHTLIQDNVYYTPYVDTASSRSFEDARQKVIRKKLKGVAKKVAREVVKYFAVSR